MTACLFLEHSPCKSSAKLHNDAESGAEACPVMQCPHCQAENPPTAASCANCRTPLPWGESTLGATGSDLPLPPGASPRAPSAWSIAVTSPHQAMYGQGEELVGTM